MAEKKTKRPTVADLEKIKRGIETALVDMPCDLIAKMYPCQMCGQLFDETAQAYECCHLWNEYTYVCVTCDEATKRRSREHDDWCFDDEDALKQHIREKHLKQCDKDAVGETEQAYLDALREGRCSVQWLFEERQRNEYLIPV